MAEQLPTPKNSNNFTEQKNKWINSIKDNLNYISIALMILTNILISLLRVENGSIGLNYPSTALGWVLWAGQITLSTFIGVMILNFFRRQGIRDGHKKISDTYSKYLDAITTNTKENKPRGLKEYLKKEATKDTISKALILISISLITGSLLISANWNNILSLAINIILAVGFGIKSMLEAEDYVCTELIVWYQQKIDSLKEEKENVKLHGDECELGFTKPSGVQQETELVSRQPNSDNNEPS